MSERYYRYSKLIESTKSVKSKQVVSSGGVRDEQALVLRKISTMNNVPVIGLDLGRGYSPNLEERVNQLN